MEVHEGEGWRLVYDPARQPFVVLIGGGSPAGGGWAAELTAVEAGILRSGVGRLVAQHGDLVPGLMAEEAIELALELACGEGVLWLALEGDRHRWQLRFVLTPANGLRALEGSWDGLASGPLAAALAALPPLEAGGRSGFPG